MDKTLDKNTGYDGTHQERINNTRLLVVVGHNAADEGGLGGHQHVDQVVQLVAEVGAHSLEVGHLGGSLGLHVLLLPQSVRLHLCFQGGHLRHKVHKASRVDHFPLSALGRNDFCVFRRIT